MTRSELRHLQEQPSFLPRPAALSLLISLAFAPTAFAAGQAAAAETPAAPAAEAGDTVVTVTATRRREPAREVPMQVNLVSTQQLEKSGAKNLNEYLADQPGVDIKTLGGSGMGSVTIRGVSTGDQPSTVVGLYVDDVAVGSSNAFVRGSYTALDMGLLDLHHIEVLRGPQGTLYGAGAMGGLVKYVTNEPNASAFSGKIAVGASQTRNGEAGHTVNGVLNMPLSEDVAALRISAYTDTAGGYVDAVGLVPGKDVNGGRSSGVRASLLVDPSQALRLRLTATTQKIRRNGRDFVDYGFATGRPIEGELTQRQYTRQDYVSKTNLLSADIEYNFSWGRLNSISSVQTNHIDTVYDYSSVYVPLLGSLGMPAESVGVVTGSDLNKRTQELRLTSQTGAQLEWLAGLYYTRERGGNDQQIATTVPGGAIGPDLLLASLPTMYREAAAYGDVTWKFTPKLSVTGGIRVAHNKQLYQQASSGVLAGGSSTVYGDSKETSRTYMGTLAYALTPVSNVYFRAASGFRPGGPNSVVRDIVTGLPTAPTSFGHDTLWSYEAGYKADLLNKTLNVEAAVYDIHWDKIQQVYAVNGVGVIVNGGKARVRGAELGIVYKPTRALRLNGGLTLIDAELSESGPGLGSAGARLPNSAKVAASFGVQRDFDLLGHKSYAGATARFTGNRSAGFEGSTTLPNYRLPGYALADFQAGMDFGRYQLQLYLRNAFDKRAQVAASTSLAALGGPVQVAEARPRTAGINLAYSF
jgi:iron complex outermembrane receptor protein